MLSDVLHAPLIGDLYELIALWQFKKVPHDFSPVVRLEIINLACSALDI